MVEVLLHGIREQERVAGEGLVVAEDEPAGGELRDGGVIQALAAEPHAAVDDGGPVHRVANGALALAGEAGFLKLAFEGEAELFHDAFGCLIAGHGAGDDAFGLVAPGELGEEGLGAFGGEALAPEVAAEAPADVELAGRIGDGVDVEPPGELVSVKEIGGEEAPAGVEGVVLYPAGEDFVFEFGGIVGLAGGDVAHDLRVAVEGDDGRQISEGEAAEDEARGGER